MNQNEMVTYLRHILDMKSSDPELKLEIVPESDPDALHCEFRTIIMLLSLATSFNYEGDSVLGALEETQGPLDHPQDFRRLAVNAFTTVLVRNHEVVAAMANSATESLGITINDTSDLEEMMEKVTDANQAYISTTIKSFTAVTNPDNRLNPNPTDHFEVLSLDKSNWNDGSQRRSSSKEE